jgi:chromate transporter
MLFKLLPSPALLAKLQTRALRSDRAGSLRLARVSANQATSAVGSSHTRSLFLSFLRLGVTAFGGPAIIAYVRDLAVKKKQWLSGESFGDGLALCQTIPGATGMQSAAYVGLKVRGFSGAAAAYLGFVTPAFVLMLVLSVLYKYGQEAPLILSLFSGLRAIVVALMANAVISFGRSTIKKWWGLAVVAGAAIALFFGINPIYVIFAAAVVGLLLPAGSSAQTQPSGDHSRLARHKTFLQPVATMLAVAAVAMGLLYAFERPLFDLALTMLRIDLFAFGGGFASVPLMQHEFVDVRHWVEAQAFVDGIALGQVTPGPIVITATFVGYMVAGFAGAVVATAAIFLPSFTLLVLVEPYFARLKRNCWFQKAVTGILLSFVGLILAVTVRLGINVTWEIWSVVLAVAAFAALRLKVDVLWVVLAGGVISVIVGLF